MVRRHIKPYAWQHESKYDEWVTLKETCPLYATFADVHTKMICAHVQVFKVKGFAPDLILCGLIFALELQQVPSALKDLPLCQHSQLRYQHLELNITVCTWCSPCTMYSQCAPHFQEVLKKFLLMQSHPFCFSLPPDDAHLAWVPLTAAGLSLGGGYIQSVMARDHETLLLWPDWYWSMTFGKKTTNFKAKSSISLSLYLCWKGHKPVMQPEGWFCRWDKGRHRISVWRWFNIYSWLLLS